MKEKYSEVILNIAKFVFAEDEYYRFTELINKNLWNTVRLMVEEKVEYLSITANLDDGNEVGEAQFEACKQLDTYVTEVYLEELVLKNGIEKE